MSRLKCVLLALLLIFSSCSVKEDREACPGWLTVDFSGFGRYAKSVLVFGWSSGRVAYADTCQFVSDSLGFCVHMVDKASTISTVLGGVKRSMMIEDKLVIPNGQSFDPLFAFSERVECYQEESVSIAVPQKHYTRIYLNLEGGAENSPYYFMVKSDVSGLSLLNLMPISGPFECYLMPTTNEKCYIDIPRQVQESDALTLYAISDGEVKFTVSLASILRNQEYDWGSTSLDDVTIDLDYSEMNTVVRIKEWIEGDNLEIIY